VLIASSARCKEQFFRIGNFAYGLQFHIETTGGMINNWIKEDKEFVLKGLGLNGKKILKLIFKSNSSTINITDSICNSLEIKA